MTPDQATSHARQLAIQLINLLSPFQASVGTSVQYGQKLVLIRPTGERCGQLVLYVGKKGPRLVTTELQQPTADELAQIEQAWSTLTNPAGSPSNTTSLAGVPSSVTELWVDGACLQHNDGLQFGWAFAIRRHGTVIHTAQGHAIPEQAVPHRNVGSELEATLQGLRWCTEHGVREVLVHHDYTGIAQWVTGTWRAKQPYTQAYVETVHSFPLTVRFQKVLAHSGILTNELVDRLATESAQQSPMYRLPINTPCDE
jgi:ribonuclease HI